MIDGLPTEIILMIFEHLDAQSRENFILVCKRLLFIVRCDPKIGNCVTIPRVVFNYNVDFMNALFLNWPALKKMTLIMEGCRFPELSEFLQKLKFESCKSLENVEIKTSDLKGHLYPKGKYQF